MKKFRLTLLFVFATLCALAQDTTVVQTLTFDSTWTRRGKWVFPPATEKFRKILMVHTLKCFPGVSGDGKYACGEWDYLTYTFVYNNKGKLDSTYQSRNNYTINNSTPDSFPYTNTPVWDRYKRFQKYVTRTVTTSLNTTQVGQQTGGTAAAFSSADGAARTQYLWRASELSSAGLSAGNITGLRVKVQNVGAPIKNLRIKIKHCYSDSLMPGHFEDSLTTVFDYQKTFTDTGWTDFQFLNPFSWNGTNNVLVEFSFDNTNGATNNILACDNNVPFVSGISTSGKNIAMNFNGGGDFIDLGQKYLVSGNSPRTIEAWAWVNAFNDGGIFQAGATGSTGQDFSLRTTGTANVFRAQTWGATDFDVTLNNTMGKWHHYAMSYDGSTINVYFDGQLAGSKTASLNTAKNNIWLGQWGGTFFKGKIDNFRVWNKALSGNTISSWYYRTATAAHPDFASLQAEYKFSEGSGNLVNDNSPKAQAPGTRNGSAWWNTTAADELFYNGVAVPRIMIVFEKGVYTTKLDSVLVTDSVMRAPVQAIQYNNTAPNKQVADNASNHPSLPTDTLNVWATGYSYTYNPNGSKADSTLIPAQNTLRKALKEWYSPNVVYEIGRFITPYGINLNMGSGYSYVYDVTDYEPLLHDTVDLAAGNNQELIDVKFLFIKGTPPAEVNRIVHLSDKGAPSYSFANLDKDISMKPKTIVVDPASVLFRVKTRITGHGHNSNDGNYPHCCEWKDNSHYLFANNQQVASWKIFRYTECALNPLYPQGGTWPGAREGWCPGDLVQEYAFDVTPNVTSGNITLDYRIDPVPADNQGMGGGNYVLSMHMIEYKNPAHQVDAEMYDIISPSNVGYYSRMNPICIEPKVVVRNAGKNPLTNVTISYGIAGGPQKTYTWYGNLKFMESAQVLLPVPDGSFWAGNGTGKFTATITKANGLADPNSENNSASSTFKLPDIYPGKIIMNLRTNNTPEDNKLVVRNTWGDVIFTRQNMTANTNYFDTLNLGAGCYTIELTDEGQDGLSYWANTAQGNGYFRIRNNTSLLKNFNADFGYKIFYAFGIGQISNVQEQTDQNLVDVYPNPSNGQFNIVLDGLKGNFDVEVYSSSGQRVWQQQLVADGYQNHPVQLHPKPGVYLVRISGAEQVFTRKVVIR